MIIYKSFSVYYLAITMRDTLSLNDRFGVGFLDIWDGHVTRASDGVKFFHAGC